MSKKQNGQRAANGGETKQQPEVSQTSPPHGRWTPESKEKAKAKTLKEVSDRLEARIDEVFTMADEHDDIIDWADLREVRLQICGAIADDLHRGLGETVELILEMELKV